MATPTEAEIQAAIKNAVHVFETLREGVQTGGGNSLVTLLHTFEQSLRGDASHAALTGMEVVREALVSGISPANLRAILDPLWCDYGRLLGYAEKEPEEILDRLYDEFDENSKNIKTRSITYGTPAFSGAVGNGTIHRITVDSYNRNIEALDSLPSGGENKRARCVLDQAYVDRHQEVFLFSSEPSSTSGLERIGAGLSLEIAAASPANSLLSNSSLMEGTSGSDVTDWTFSNGSESDTAQDAENFYRAVPGHPVGSLQLDTSVTLEQKLTVAAGKFGELLPNTPYYLHVAYNREIGEVEGDLTIHLGSKTATVNLSAQTGWGILRIAGLSSWHRQFMEDELKVEIEWVVSSEGSLLVGDVMLVPFVNFDGTWYLPVGGQTPFLIGDTATWTDSETGSVLQNWIADTYGKYLPHAASPTWTDP